MRAVQNSPLKSIPWDGQRISKPGLYSGVPLDDYHRGDICDGPSISSSGLRQLWQTSPKHYWDNSPLNPLRKIEADKPHFIIGRAMHHLALGELGFADQYIFRPERAPDGRDWHGSNKSCIKWLADTALTRKTVLTPEMGDNIVGMAKALGMHPLVQQGILSGLIERSMFWKDEETGVWLKARPDIIPTSSGDYSDLKTTDSVLYRDLKRSLSTYGYHQQGALVLEGAKALGLETADFTLVWVEKTRPWCVRSQTLKSEDLARGAKQNRVMLRTFHECYVAKAWPGPGDDRDDAEYADLSEGARKEIDDRLQYQLREAA